MANAKTAKKTKKKPAEGRAVGKLAMTREEMGVCQKWAESTKNCKEFDAAEFERLFSKAGYAVSVYTDSEDNSQYATLKVPGRSPRLLDLPGLVLLRLITAAVGSISIRTSKDGLDYMRCSIPSDTKKGSIPFTAMSLLACAPKGREARVISQKSKEKEDGRDTHYDLRRRNLETHTRTPAKDTSKGKFVLEHAIRYAVRNYQSRHMRNKSKLGVKTEDFRYLLQRTVETLNTIPLGRA